MPDTAPSNPQLTTPQLTEEDVRQVAIIARIGMTDQDLQRFRTELTAILAHCNDLQQVDTEGVEPTAHVTGLENIMAADASRPSLPRDAVLANAPETEEGLIRVKPVLD